MDRKSQILELIGQVYDAALDQKLWADLSSEIARTFGGNSCVIQVQNRSTGFVDWISQTPNYTPESADAYRRYYYKHDVWVARAAAKASGRVFGSDDLIEDEEFERTEIHVDFHRKLGFFYVVGAVAPLGSDRRASHAASAGSIMGIIGVHRPRQAGLFDATAKKELQLFLPHLQRALQVRQRLSIPSVAEQAAVEGLERTGTATLVVCRDGTILYANRQAETLLREGKGIIARHGRLSTTARADAQRLTLLIARAVDTAVGRNASSGSALAIEREDQLPLTILVAPFRPAREGLGTAMSAALVFIRDPETPTPITLTLQGLLGLTPAEAAVASMLADGKSIDAIAAHQGITVNTARVHVKNIFAKTGTTRQAQLVALILRSVAAINLPG
jgi:DNA-binding CsgD family transcriptional regulator/PAS domain-containing protein